MIRSFKGKTIEAVAQGRKPKGFPPDLLGVTRRKLFMLDNAVSLEDLRTPPATVLKLLKTTGLVSIRSA